MSFLISPSSLSLQLSLSPGQNSGYIVLIVPKLDQNRRQQEKLESPPPLQITLHRLYFIHQIKTSIIHDNKISQVRDRSNNDDLYRRLSYLTTKINLIAVAKHEMEQTSFTYSEIINEIQPSSILYNENSKRQFSNQRVVYRSKQTFQTAYQICTCEQRKVNNTNEMGSVFLKSMIQLQVTKKLNLDRSTVVSLSLQFLGVGSILP